MQQQPDDLEDNTIQFADGDEDEEGPTMQGQPQVKYRMYSHSGRYWHVPHNFSFPTGVNLEAGWKLWIQGLPANETVDGNGNRLQAPIRPFRKLKLDMLPEPVKTKFQLQWWRIFSMMEQAPGIEIRETNVDAEHIRASFNVGKEYLKTRVGYCFQNQQKNPMEWQISYWSKKVAPSSIVLLPPDPFRVVPLTSASALCPPPACAGIRPGYLSPPGRCGRSRGRRPAGRRERPWGWAR